MQRLWLPPGVDSLGSHSLGEASLNVMRQSGDAQIVRDGGLGITT